MADVFFLFGGIVSRIFWAIATLFLMKHKRRSGFAGFISGLFFGGIAFLIGLFLRKIPDPSYTVEIRHYNNDNENQQTVVADNQEFIKEEINKNGKTFEDDNIPDL